METVKSALTNTRVIVIFVLVVVIFLIARAGGSTEPGSDGSYTLTTSDGSSTAVLVAESDGSNSQYVEYAFLITDPEIVSNGVCRSTTGFCDSERNRELQEIQYRYGISWASTEGSDNLLATPARAVYCNLDLVTNDLSSVFNSADPRTDFNCGQFASAGFDSTNSIVATNGAYVGNLDDLLSDITINLYDTSAAQSMEVEPDGTIVGNDFNYQDIPTYELVKSFNFEIQ